MQNKKYHIEKNVSVDYETSLTYTTCLAQQSKTAISVTASGHPTMYDMRFNNANT